MSDPRIHEDVQTSARYRYFALAAIAAGVDLLAVGGSACRRIIVVGAGTLVVTPVRPITAVSPSATESFPVTDGMQLDVAATAIGATTSGITGVTVLW